MDASSTVSSLYGPGPFAGWLCTVLSVFISWVFNRQSKARDTIGNDLIAAILLPAIAAIHHLHELRKYSRNDVKGSLETLDVTFCIVLWFVGIGQSLFGIAIFSGRVRRSIFVGTVNALCSSVVFAQAANGALAGPIRAPNNQLVIVYVAGFLFCFFVFLDIVHPRRPEEHSRSGSDTLSTRRMRHSSQLDHFLVRRSRQAVLALYPLCFSTIIVAIDLFCQKNTPGEATLLVVFSVPQTGYLITELDQAVALGAGVLTAACSIYEGCNSHRLTAWEKYQDWKNEFESLVEEGLAGDEEGRCKDQLGLIAQKEEEILGTPSNVGLLAVLQHMREEQKKVEGERLAQALRESRFI